MQNLEILLQYNVWFCSITFSFLYICLLAKQYNYVCNRRKSFSKQLTRMGMTSLAWMSWLTSLLLSKKSNGQYRLLTSCFNFVYLTVSFCHQYRHNWNHHLHCYTSLSKLRVYLNSERKGGVKLGSWTWIVNS